MSNRWRAKAASARLTVLVVGQVPPPVNGQSLMIQEFLAGEYEGLRLVHVPMSFSRSTDEIGSFGVRKLFHLLAVLGGILKSRLIAGPAVLYYPPAGADLNPVLRDLVLLIPTRWLFRYTVFHFHAAGLSKIFSRLPGPLKPLFHLAYDQPDLAIFTTEATSGEAEFLRARATAIVPCGAPDPEAIGQPAKEKPSLQTGVPEILFAGILCEGKGLLTLIEACRILRSNLQRFKLVCLGAFQDQLFEREIRDLLVRYGLEEQVLLPGVLTGEAKRRAFLQADIFCFPSHYPAESFGVVLIEAMSYRLPIVATDWQGIPEVTGRSGGSSLVPIRDSPALAHSLSVLLSSPSQRKVDGDRNRERYSSRYTLALYREGLQKAILSLRGDRVDPDFLRIQALSGPSGD